ncbi:MAG: bifunctional 5,10-methylene-tetrahydrofolate dehydrogenase/5,10-methylene-tetrahydrofolate cyclohydrolase [Phycisphaerae bacterium]|nr:bifunctional 5,10-methylene-tetrahydrofolate dehydrogenase/5,10-methylene-tetrahydrofolate cyclohydrolase [Phycisphaerae bacterium]
MSVSETGRILDGRAVAAKVMESLVQRTAALRDTGHQASLDALIVGANQSGSVYAANQAKMCAEVGIEYRLHELPEASTQEDILALIDRLNADDQVTAIMLHLPLPQGVGTELVQSRIDVSKDVEGVNPANIGNVLYGRRSLVPCTALATMTLIESTGIDLPGKLVVCIGASNIVGKPVAVLLMRAEATVVSTNIHTPDIAAHCRQADVIVSAVGKPGLIHGDMVRPGAVVIDVGITRVMDSETGRKRTAGDVDFESVQTVAGWLTPVPGGVGPVTVAMLLRNTVDAAERRISSTR